MEGSKPEIGNRLFTGKETNAAVVFDAISEGEIVGLVNGDASIYFDDVPLRDGITQMERGSFHTFSTTVAASAVVTLSDGALDNVDVTGSPKRLIHIYGAGKQGVTSDPDITFTCIAGDHTIVASAAFFTANMVKKTRQTNGAGMLRIVGAGFEELGSDLLTMITVFTDTTHVEVDVAPVTSVTAAAGGIDLISTIISYDPSNNQVTMSDNAVTAITGSATTGAGYTIIGPANPNAINTSKSGLKRNFDNVQWEFRTGHKHQTITNLIGNAPPSASFVYSPGQRMSQTEISGVTGTGTTSPYTYTAATIGATEASETDAVGWTIEMPTLIAQSSKSSNEHNSWVEITVDFEYTREAITGSESYHSSRIVGRSDSELGSASIHDFSDNTRGFGTGFIIHRTRKPIVEQYEFSVQNFKPFTNWRLKFQRVNEPMKRLGHHEHMNEAIIKHIESHITDKLTYPYTAYAAVSFSSKDFSTTPKRGYHIRGKKIQVPTNYLSREEMASTSASYTRNVSTGAQETNYQDWDGNFRGDVSTFAATHANHALVYTNNPAWIFYDLARDPRYGLGHIVDASLIDKYSLYQVARYCDELVPDGKGGQEPRFTCNVYITKAQEAYKVLKDLASVFRGMTLWMDGQLVAVQDRPREPIYTFSQGNVVGGVFSYETTSERIRANQYLVKWMDPEDNFKEKVEIVDDVDNIIDKGRIVSKDFKAFGCTSQGQANRIGRWAITTDKLETELCKFSTGMNAAMLRPGDVINIQDATIDAIQFSGRIKAGTSTTVVTLDRAITLASSTTYKLHLIYPEGGAYLVSPEKVHINSTTYTKGDLIFRDESNALINTFAKATNVKEDSDAASNGGTKNNGKVELSWSENSRVETKTINTNNTTIAAGSNVTVTSAFSSTPNSEVIWAISGRTTTSTNEVTGNPKQYRIMGLEDEGQGVFNIAAALYKDEKYDIVEKGYTLEPTRESVLKKPVNMHRDATHPSPASLTFSLQAVAASHSTSDSTEDVTGALEAIISWATPVETWVADNILNATFVNEALDNSETTITVGDASSFAATGYGVIEAGSSQEEVVYWSAKSSNDLTVTRGALRSIKQAHDTGVSFEERRNYERVPPGITQFEIEHNFGIVSKNDGFNREFVGAKTYAFIVPNVSAGTYTVRVRAIYENGALSEFVVLEKTITAPVTGQSQSLEKLTFGGTISSGITIDSSGNWDIASSPYTVVNTSGKEYSVTQGTQSHAQRRQAFGSLTDGQTAYALFDASAYASDPWRAIIQVTDTTYHKGQTGIAGSFTWWKDVGESANGLTQASGTITTTLDSDTITGNGSAAFTTDFAAGDFIRLHDSASTSFGTGSWYGYIDQVVSDTEMKVVGAVTKAFTAKYAYKGTFRPDFINDFILSKVIRNSSSSYTLNNYVTSSSTLPIHTTGTAVPSGSAVAGSTYLRTGVTPQQLYINNGSSWALMGVNSNTTYVLPTYTSGSGVPNNNTTPSPNPLGSTYLNTATDPDTLYISDGSNWILQSVNTNTTYTLPTHTSGSGVPDNGTTPSPNPLNSTYLNTATTPDTLYISDGSDWALMGVNSNTTYVLPTSTSSSSAPNNNTVPSPNPMGSTWLHTTPTPSVLYIANATDWVAQDTNTNTTYTLPTHTTSTSDPSGSAVVGSTHLKTGVTPEELWIYTSGSGWIHQQVNIDTNTTYVLPTHTSGSGVPNNNTTPSPNPLGSTYLNTATTPDTLYISDGSDWVLMGVNSNTVYTLPNNVLIGTPTVSGQTVTFPRNSGSSYTLNTQDTNTTYSAGDFAITSLDGYTAALYANGSLSNSDVLDSIGFTPYNVSNPSGYTNSPNLTVSGAGTVHANNYTNTTYTFEDLLYASPSTLATWTTNDGDDYVPTGQTQDLTVTYDGTTSSATCTVRWTWTNVSGDNDYISACAFTGSSTGFTLGSITTLSGNDVKYATAVVTHTASSETITLAALLSQLHVGGGGK